MAPGQLVLVPAVLHDQRLVDEEDGKAGAYPKPEVIVLAGGEALVEEPDLVEEKAVHENRRRRDDAERKGLFEDPAPEFLVLFHRIHPAAVADPNLVRVAEEKRRG